MSDWQENEHGYFKKFGRGTVTIYKNSLTVGFDYGANSDMSYSSTRWNYGRSPHTVEEAKAAVERGNGRKLVWLDEVPEAEKKAHMRASLIKHYENGNTCEPKTWNKLCREFELPDEYLLEEAS